MFRTSCEPHCAAKGFGSWSLIAETVTLAGNSRPQWRSVSGIGGKSKGRLPGRTTSQAGGLLRALDYCYLAFVHPAGIIMAFSQFCNGFYALKTLQKRLMVGYKKNLDFALNCVFMGALEKVNISEIRYAWLRLPGSTPEELGSCRCKG